METIAQVLKRSNKEMKAMQRESLNFLKKTNTPIQLTSKEFLTKYNPDYILCRCKGMTIQDINTLCIFADTPTLSELKAWYGANTPIVWLMSQLRSLSEFCGAKEKMQSDIAEKTANIIYANYYYLTASELLLFFFKFSTGKYGKFYGVVDPQTIITALQSFVTYERNPAIERKEMEEHLKQREQEKLQAIKYDEYVRLKNNNN